MICLHSPRWFHWWGFDNRSTNAAICIEQCESDKSTISPKQRKQVLGCSSLSLWKGLERLVLTVDPYLKYSNDNNNNLESDYSNWACSSNPIPTN